MAGNRYMKFHNEIEDAIEIINDYELYYDKEFDNSTKVTKKDLKHEELLVNSNKLSIYNSEYDNRVSYNIFNGNMHIRIENKGTEKVMSIHIKKNDNADWIIPELNQNDGGLKLWDYSHPLNESLRVFVWYDVPVLNITRSVGEVYQHGTWDKYICTQMDDFLIKMDGRTDDAKFNSNYKESDWELFKNWIKDIFHKK